MRSRSLFSSPTRSLRGSRAALRWLGLFSRLDRRGVTLEDVQEAADAFACLREDCESAATKLRRLSAR